MKKSIADYPELVKQWHPIKNGDLKPENFTPGSHKEVWWKCPIANDHEWIMAISVRTGQKQKCPYCANKRVVVSNCLSTTHPQLIAQWHPTKNQDITPNMITIGSSKKVWWKCPVADDHEWNTKVYNRKK